MQSVSCPLTNSKNVTLIEEIKVHDIIEMYRKTLNCDVSADFGSIETIGFYHALDSDLKFFNPLITGSEPFYEDLQRIPWYYLEEKDEYNFSKQYIHERDTVLEIGCGKGAFANMLDVRSYVGLEFNQKAIDRANSTGIKVLKESIQEHAEKYPEQYDVACSFQVLEHVADTKAFLESSIKCVKPGGLLICSVPSADSFIANVTNNMLNMPPHHVTWWSKKSINYVAKLFDLEIIDIHEESLADIHKRWYFSHLIKKSIEAYLYGDKYKSKIMDSSIKHKVISKIASLGARFLEGGILDSSSLPFGHTITAVYRKKLP